MFIDETTDLTSLVDISCNWLSNVDGKDIRDCMVVRLHQTREEDIDEMDYSSMLQFCINFMQPNLNNEDCDQDLPTFTIELKSKPRYIIKKVVLCSQAKIIELFGNNEEYISTHNSTGINNFNIHTMCVNNTACSLKLKQLTDDKFGWIYCLHVYLLKTEDNFNCKIGPVNLQNVINILNSESVPTNVSMLLSTLSQRNLSSKNSTHNNECFENGIVRLEKLVQEKFNSMEQQIHTVASNVEMLNTKFDNLLALLNKEK
ncbi:uncharacterized protein LOC126833319 [Adelges cooleyi]|uniref:uncharacterized protein LOC126833319 n=1 Tax=Adelges cooleyi TaxID=133065 RepID=UPI0021800D9C|nr:uncharacterized protein LOC126833319 [Adelges cooleyi]XP_050420537.1 uncharacterized protein LOC126833319 [Adelges cooleyi]